MSILRATSMALLVLTACGDDSTGSSGGGTGGDAAATTSAQASTGSGTGGGGTGGEGTGGEGTGGGAVCSPEGALDIAVCDPATGVFSVDIDNPFYPLPVGFLRVFEGIEDGAELLLEIEVLDETLEVAGVETRVVQEREYEDGEIVEISWNYFVQAEDGSVCYFGEDVDIYEDDGTIVHDGAWLAGDGDNLPGIVMPANPALGDVMVQEVAPGIAEDQATITAVGETVTTPFDDFSDTLSMSECSPLEPGHISLKDYARGLGMIVDAEVRLVEVEGI
jgi:hypothetical protein